MYELDYLYLYRYIYMHYTTMTICTFSMSLGWRLAFRVEFVVIPRSPLCMSLWHGHGRRIYTHTRTRIHDRYTHTNSRLTQSVNIFPLPWWEHMEHIEDASIIAHLAILLIPRIQFNLVGTFGKWSNIKPLHQCTMLLNGDDNDLSIREALYAHTHVCFRYM